jgi:hypothetical protein
MQQAGLGEQCDNTLCPFGGRPFGTDTCIPCADDPVGIFYNSALVRKADAPESWTAPRCQSCSPGKFADGSAAAVDRCFPCPAGKVQPDAGKGSCSACEAGKFQPDVGQTACLPCDRGGYCQDAEACGGGFIPCEPGTYNNYTGSSSHLDCKTCPRGKFSATIGATNQTSCLPCAPGAYTDVEGSAACLLMLSGFCWELDVSRIQQWNPFEKIRR